jgi:uncharacterized protein (TIGR02001 family)
MTRQLICVWLGSCVASAAWPAGLQPGGAATVVSEYVYRGITQSGGHAAAQLDLHVRPRDDWSLGVWTSQVELLPARRSAELDLYSRWHWLLPGDFSASAGATYYAYPGDPRRVSYRYTELETSIQWRDRVALNVGWTPNLTLFSFGYGVQQDRQAWSADLTTSQRLPGGLIAQAGIGYFDAVGLRNAGYAYGSAGLTRYFGHWRAELTYIWVQQPAHRIYASGAAGGPLTGSLSWQF